MALKVLGFPAVCGCLLLMLISVNWATQDISVGHNGNYVGKDGHFLNIVELVNIILRKVLQILTLAIKIDSYDDRCPASEGWFFAPGTDQSQCLRVVPTLKSWEASRDECKKLESGGVKGQLARPYNARALAMYLFERYDVYNFWVNAKGSSAKTFVWNTQPTVPREGTKVPHDSPLWAPGQPGEQTTDEFCMMLLTKPDKLKNNPLTPYSTDRCGNENYMICEKSLAPY